MQIRSIFLFSLILLVSSIAFVSAEYSLDIKISNTEYSIGDKMSYRVLLLENNIPVSEKVLITFSDVLGEKKIEKEVQTNVENFLTIEDDFPSGFWNVVAEFGEKRVNRVFSVKEKESVEFSILDDKLIIKNNGNVFYSKEIQILIGDKIIKQIVNIGIGESKEIRLVGKGDYYNVKVTDGEHTISKQNVYLTGDVIGALDESLINGSPLGGVREPGKERFLSSDKLPIAFIFVGAVMGLGILLLIERHFRKR